MRYSILRWSVQGQPTALSEAFASLSSGQWGTVTAANQMNADAGGTGDGMFSFSPQLTWDSLHNVMRFWGGCHGTGGTVNRLWLGTYTDSMNSWPSTPISAAINPTAAVLHAYCAGTVDQQTGDFYGAAPFDDWSNARRYSWLPGSWSAPLPDNSIAGAHCVCTAVIYHPGLYGGQGGLVMGSNSGIWTLNLRAGSPTWTIILDRTSAIDAMDGFPLGVYDLKTQCVYVGGNDGNGNLWKIPASAGAGTPTAVALPSMGLFGSSGTRVLCSSGNSANNMVVMDRSGNVEEFNGTSWSTVSTTVPSSMLSATDNWWSGGACPAYGGILFVKGERTPGPKTALTMHIWKR